MWRSRLLSRLARRRAGRARKRAGGDVVASAGYPDESGGRALEVAGESCLDGRPPHGFAQESLYARVHVASLHRVALVDEHLGDGLDNPALPWMRGGERPAWSSGSARSTLLATRFGSVGAPLSKASSGAGGLAWCPLRSISDQPEAPRPKPMSAAREPSWFTGAGSVKPGALADHLRRRSQAERVWRRSPGALAPQRDEGCSPASPADDGASAAGSAPVLLSTADGSRRSSPRSSTLDA